MNVKYNGLLTLPGHQLLFHDEKHKEYDHVIEHHQIT